MKHQQRQEDILFSVCVFFGAFAINLLIRKLFTTQTLVPMIFVFGVFLISLKTHGYCYGIVSAVLSVFAVNFAFTYPYYTLDFFVEESILSAIIMLVVAVSTSTLNSRIRDQENLRAESEKERMRGNLLRAISHDLRTPLTSIYGSSSTLISKKDALSEEQQLKLLGEIQEDSEWLIRMVENLLAVTRIDGAKVKVVKTPIVLDEVLQEAPESEGDYADTGRLCGYSYGFYPYRAGVVELFGKCRFSCERNDRAEAVGFPCRR